MSPREDRARLFDRDYFEGGSRRATAHYDHPSMVRLFEPTARILRALGARRVLDVGCATGPLVQAMADLGVDARGVDVSRYAMERSPVRDRLSWADVEEEPLPFETSSFDTVVAIETLEHLRKVDSVIAEMVRVLRPGGLFYIAAPERNEDSDYDETHVTLLSRREWRERVTRAGLAPLGRARHREVGRAVLREHRDHLQRSHVPRPLLFLGSGGRLLMARYLAFLGRRLDMIFATGRRHAHILAERK